MKRNYKQENVYLKSRYPKSLIDQDPLDRFIENNAIFLAIITVAAVLGIMFLAYSSVA